MTKNRRRALIAGLAVLALTGAALAAAPPAHAAPVPCKPPNCSMIYNAKRAHYVRKHRPDLVLVASVDFTVDADTRVGIDEVCWTTHTMLLGFYHGVVPKSAVVTVANLTTGRRINYPIKWNTRRGELTDACWRPAASRLRYLWGRTSQGMTVTVAVVGPGGSPVSLILRSDEHESF